MINPLAAELNQTIKNSAPVVYGMLSRFGKEVFFPKGILHQSALARKQAKKINATVGIATEDGEAIYLDCIHKHFNFLEAKQLYPYAPVTGRINLRKFWQQKMLKESSKLNPKKISVPIVTQGLTQGISIAAHLFVDSNTKVVMPDLAWDNYELIFQTQFQAEIITYPLFVEKKFNLSGFKKAIENITTEQKIVVMLNFPNNPTGYSPTMEELDRIANILEAEAQKGKKIIALCDDAYFGLFYEEETAKESIFGRLAGIHKNIIALAINGATKEMFVWGFRVGFLTFGIALENSEAENLDEVYKTLEQKIKGIIRASVSNAGNPTQSILEKVLQEKSFEKEQKEKNEILANRYRVIKELLAQEKYQEHWETYPFNSGYFLCLQFKKVSAIKLWEILLNEHQIGTIYINDTDLRLAFSSVDEEKIPELVETIYQAACQLST